MSRRVLLLLVLTLGAPPACDAPELPQPATGQRADPVVYGADDRAEVYAADDPALRDLARRSVAALVSVDQLAQVGPNAWQPVGPPMGLALGLCADEPFADQTAGARCSGTLIAPDIFLTAGHCIDVRSCGGQLIVFDWLYEAEGRLATIEDADVYRCAAVLTQRLDERLDYAVVRLDRPVEGDRVPAALRSAPEGLPRGEALTLIGYPGGIPAKIAAGGSVVDPGAPALDVFEASIDAFGGNSGSGVFDGTGAVVGVLVAGQEDYVRAGPCLTVNRLPAEPPEAEQVVYLHRALEGLCAERPNVSLCGEPGGAWCDACDADADCHAGWRCVGTCVPPCDGPDVCLEGHACAPDGLCRPSVELACRGALRFSLDACGEARPVEQCAHPALCRPDRCLPAPPGDACGDAIPLQPVTQQLEVDLAGGYTWDEQRRCVAEPDAHFAVEVDAPILMTVTARGRAPTLALSAGCNGRLDCVPAAEGPLQAELTPGERWILTVSDAGDPPAPVSLQLRFGAPCASICPPGARRCADPGAVETCVEDATGCGAWRVTQLCDDDAPCEQGACRRIAPPDPCAAAAVVEPRSFRHQGQLGDRLDQVQGRCGGDGPDRLFRFTVDEPTRLRAQVSGLDGVLDVRRGCLGPSVACNDDAAPPGGGGARVEVDLEPGEHTLVLDSVGAPGDAEYDLVVRFEPVPPPPPLDAAPPPPLDAGVVVDARPPPPRDARPPPPDAVPPRRDAVPPPRDALPPPPDARSPDAALAPAPDTDGGAREGDRVVGRGCAAADGPNPTPALLLVLLVALRRRRR